MVSGREANLLLHAPQPLIPVVSEIVRQGADYDLPLIEPGFLPAYPIPRGRTCQPPDPAFWVEIGKLKAEGIRSAIEELQGRVALLRLIVKG